MPEPCCQRGDVTLSARDRTAIRQAFERAPAHQRAEVLESAGVPTWLADLASEHRAVDGLYVGTVTEAIDAATRLPTPALRAPERRAPERRAPDPADRPALSLSEMMDAAERIALGTGCEVAGVRRVEGTVRVIVRGGNRRSHEAMRERLSALTPTPVGVEAPADA